MNNKSIILINGEKYLRTTASNLLVKIEREVYKMSPREEEDKKRILEIMNLKDEELGHNPHFKTTGITETPKIT
mgnify:CR=1 FL=1